MPHTYKHTHTHAQTYIHSHTHTHTEMSQLQKLSLTSGLRSKAHMFGDIRCLNNTVDSRVTLLHPAETVQYTLCKIIHTEQQITAKKQHTS